MKVFVDTSALMAIIDPSDARGRAARQWITNANRHVLLTHNYVIAESLALIERRIGRSAVSGLRHAVLPILDIRWIARDEHERALDEHLQSSRRSSFVDQVSFVAMRDAGITTAFAFDDDFARAGFTVVP